MGKEKLPKHHILPGEQIAASGHVFPPCERDVDIPATSDQALKLLFSKLQQNPWDEPFPPGLLDFHIGA